METKILEALLSNGPGFMVAAIFAWLYFSERKHTAALTQKLFTMAEDSIKNDMAHTKAIETLEKTLDAALRRL